MPFMFEDLMAYKKAMEFAKKVFSLSKNIRDRTIKDQLCRAALSIPLNIAEGQGRFHQREKRQFYNTAKGSLYECVPLIQLCFHLGFFGEGHYNNLDELANESGKILAGLIKSVSKENRD